MSLYTLTVDLIAKTAGFQTDMGRAAREADKAMKKMERDVDRSVKKIIGSFGGLATGLSVGAVFATMVRNTAAAEKEFAQLEAVLKSTGEAAGYNSMQMSKMAATMAQATTHSSGEIMKAQTRLLSYSAIVGKEFPRALQLAIDQSVRLGEDLSQSAETVGKALEYPAQGVAALTKQGFRFTEEQKKMLKALEDTNRLAEAQAMVMDVMEESYKDAAKAARGTFGGAMTGLKNTMGDLLTGDTGGEGLRGAAEAVNDLSDTLNDPAVVAGFGAIVGGAMEAVKWMAQFAATTAGVTKWLGEEVAARLHGPMAEDTVRVEQKIERLNKLLDKARGGKGMSGVDLFSGVFDEVGAEAAADVTMGRTGTVIRKINEQLIKERKKLALGEEMRAAAAAMANVKAPDLGGVNRPLPTLTDPKAEAAAKRAAAAAAKLREQQLESMARYDKQAAMAAATLAGPLQAAEMAHTQRLAEIDAELKKGNMSQAAANVLKDEATAALEKSTAALREQQNAPNALLDTMTGEIRLLGMTGRARELYRRQLENERDMREAINRANEAGAGINDEVTQSLLRQARGWAETSIAAEEAAAAAESWTRVAMDAVGGVADVFADLFSGQLKSAKDFFTSLKDVFKRGLWDVMRNMMQTNFVAPMQKALESAMSGFGNAGTSGQGFGGVLSKVFSSWLGQGAGAANVATTGYGQAINGLAQTYGGTGVGSAAGAGMAGLGAAIPIAGAIIAGMTLNNAAYAQGFKIQGQTNNVSEYLVKNGHAIIALAHSTVSVTDKMLQKIGLSSKTASMISGSSLSTKAFGHAAPKIQQSGIQGSVGFGGFEGESFADIKAKGGWFRSDKRWTETGDVNPQISRAFAMAGARAGVGAKELAKQVGVDVAQALSSVKIDLGKMVLDADPEKAREQVEAKLSEIMEGLTGKAVTALGFGSLLEDAFAATDVMTALSAAMELSRNTAEALGRTINDAERAGIGRAVEWFKELSQINGTELADEIARVVGVVGDYGSLMADIDTQLMTGGLSNYQAQALAIERAYRQQAKAANDYAKALGLSGARAEDLAKIEELRAVGMGKLQAQMEIEKAASLNNLALSDLSPLRDDQKLAEAMRQLQDAVTAGDIGAANSASQAALGFGRNLFASGRDYSSLYEQVTGMLGGMQMGDLALEDGTTMGELADTLEALPEQFGKAIFELAAGMQKETTAATNEVRDAVNRGNELLEQVLEETRKGVSGGSSGRLREELNRQVAVR